MATVESTLNLDSEKKAGVVVVCVTFRSPCAPGKANLPFFPSSVVMGDYHVDTVLMIASLFLIRRRNILVIQCHQWERR